MAVIRRAWIFLLICVGSSSAQIVNVAAGRPTNITSVYDSQTGSERAVDGRTVLPCTESSIDSDDHPRWWVDLGSNRDVMKITLYLRYLFRYRRNGIKIYVSSSPTIQSGQSPCETLTNVHTTSSYDTHTFPCVAQGQYVVIEATYFDVANNPSHVTNPVLDLCEVEVYVCTASGLYGPDCNNTCNARNCLHSNSQCDRWTGQCVEGCAAGWEGTDCKSECPTTMYGPNCEKMCSARKCVESSSVCNGITGQCDGGCAAGREGVDCTTECSTGTFGSGCQQNCDDRHCLHNVSDCDHVTGACMDGCSPGWKGHTCDMRCTAGVEYGSNCSGSCLSRSCAAEHAPCPRDSGLCDGGCLPGWQGEDCTTVSACTSGWYGQSCLISCDDRHCLHYESSCHVITGECVGGCSPGWKGVDCRTRCVYGVEYGPDCAKRCSDRSCLSSNATCPHYSWRCEGGCLPGWEKEDCTSVAHIAPILAGVIATSIVVVLIVVLVAVFMVKRARSAPVENTSRSGREAPDSPPVNDEATHYEGLDTTRDNAADRYESLQTASPYMNTTFNT